MATIEQAFIECVLADLAYVGTLQKGMSQKGRADEFARRITQPLAEKFAARFEILTTHSDAASDYQAVVFKDVTTGDLYLANRGTESTTDIVNADLDLALGSGVASKQAAAMVNWWLDISSAAGSAVRQVSADGPNLAPFVPAASKTASGDIAAEVSAAVATGKLHVVGHSLGGHLTTVFTSLFANQVAHASTFNGAGMFSVGAIADIVAGVLGGHPINQLAQALGLTVQLPTAAKMDNFYAMNGMNLTTNAATFTQLGQRIEVFNEETPAPTFSNHYLYKQTDSLALAVAMQKLDPSLTLTKFNALAQAAFNVSGGSLETLLDALRRQLLGTHVAKTAIGDDGGDWKKSTMPQSRTDYQQNVKQLTENPAFQSLVGQLTLQPTDVNLRAPARTDFAALIALQDLSPIVVRGVPESVWQSTRAADYAAWQADKSSATPSTFSDQWIADRAAMLGWLVKRNLDDNTDTTIKAPQDLRFLDEARKIDLRLGSSTTGDDSRKQFHFGDGKANTLTGASKEDHLYGGSGADTLEGKDGADYLEGGADADTYVLQTGLTGIDTLVDSGSNTLQVDGKTVSGAFAQVAGMGGDIYYSADKSYQLRKAENGVWRLAAKNEGTGQYSAVADLKGWKDGDYGLSIGAPTQEPERVPAVVYPNSVAYLAMDGAAAPKGVTFGGGTKSDNHDDMPRLCVLRKACRAQNRRRGAIYSIATDDVQASARCHFYHPRCSARGIA
ncbi:MAG: hypothetical protein KJZ76_16505 [Burkholderiaceae bacterium]|nr:hypothetical protein [Burkholderiaceae bacterium]